MLRSVLVVVVVALAWPRAARADDGCANVHFVRAFDPALTTGVCREVGRVRFDRALEGSVVHLRARGAADSGVPADEAAAVRELTDLASRATVAAAALRMPLPTKVTFLLDTAEVAAENRAVSLAELEAARHDHAAEEGECTVAYHFRSADPRKLFQVAHQLFHCITTTTWDDARLSAGDADWWAEGSADFFASTLYQGGMTDVDAADFHAHESAPLFSRSHDATLFFDWYVTAPGRLKGLLDTVHDKPAGMLMVELRDDVGAHWLEFEEAYFDHTIREPGGRLIPYGDTPPPPTTRFSRTTTQTFSAAPYVVRGAILEFAEGHAYDLAGGDAEGFHWKWTEAAVGAWADRPTVVHTCHQPKRYRVVLAATDAEVTSRLRVTAREEHEADCPCLVGNWAQTPDSLARIATRSPMASMRNTTCAAAGGGIQFSVHGDHTGADVYQDFTTQCTGPTVSSTGVSHGAHLFTWAADGSQLTLTTTGGDAVDHITTTVRGHSIPQDVSLAVGGAATVTFTCTRATLHIEYPDARIGAYDYTRVGAGP